MDYRMMKPSSMRRTEREVGQLRAGRDDTGSVATSAFGDVWRVSADYAQLRDRAERRRRRFATRGPPTLVEQSRRCFRAERA
jgi:hypothetical protein